MKRKSATWVVGLASVLLAMGVTGCSLDAVKGEQTPVELEKSFAGQEISSVKVESHAIDVHLVAADRDQVQLLLKGTLSENAKDKDRENLLKASTSGSQLLVVATKPTSFMDSKGGTLQFSFEAGKRDVVGGTRIDFDHAFHIRQGTFQRLGNRVQHLLGRCARPYHVDVNSGR